MVRFDGSWLGRYFFRHFCNQFRDPTHTLVELAGARVMPEAAVYVPKRGLGAQVMPGAISDAPF